jgi:hypothetical protein
MQIIICDCGTELPFSERDLSAAAGKPFACPNCGKTRKLPLANVFTPADQHARPSPFDRRRRARSGRIIFIAAIAVILLLVLTGVEYGLHFAGIVIACGATLLLLARVIQRCPSDALATTSVALLGGIALLSSHWSVTTALMAIVSGVVIRQTLRSGRQMRSQPAPSDQWRLELPDEIQP